jgi:hypothetical protein
VAQQEINRMDIIRDNAHALYDLLCEAHEAFDGEEESVKEEHEDLIAKMDELIEKLRPPRRFTFEARITCTFEIVANSEDEAVNLLESASMDTGNLGCLINGEPIVAVMTEIEDAGKGDWSAVAIDGERV